MKKISEHAPTVRQDNSAFFILEKYNNEIQESITKTVMIIESESAKLQMTSAEYAEVIAKITSKK